MSTRSAFTIAGAVVGYYFGNTALGASIGSMVGGYVDPLQVKGPRLTDAQQQTSQDGVPIPLTFGVVRLQGNVIADGGVVEHKKKDDGKGSGTETTTYSYTRTFAIGICEGPIAGIRRIWKNGKLVFDARPEVANVTSRALTDKFLNNHTIYIGDEEQEQNSDLQAVLGADNVPAFRGLAYLVARDEPVTDYAGAIPTFEFEVVTRGTADSLEEYVPLSYPNIMPFGLNPERFGDPRDVRGDYEYAPYFYGSTPSFDYSDLESPLRVLADSFGFKPYTDLPVVMGWGIGGSGSVRGWTSANSLFPWQDRGDRLNQNNPVVTLVIPRAQFSSRSEATAIGGGGVYWPCAKFDEGIWSVRFTADSPPADPSGTGSLLSSGVVLFTGDADLIKDAEPDGNLTHCGNPGDEPRTTYAFSDYLVLCRPVPDCGQFIDPDWILVPGTSDLYTDRYGEYHSKNDCTRVTGDFTQLSVLQLTEDGLSYSSAPVGPVVLTSSTQNNPDFWESSYTLAVAEKKMPSGLVYGVDYPRTIDQACLCSVGLSIYEGDVTLAEIVAGLCIRAGLSAGEIDVSELTDRVTGFNVATQTNAADAINTLAPAFLFDGAEWDGVTHFVKRGHDHIADLSIQDSIDSDGPRIKETRSQDVELPQKITLSYFDPAADLAVTTQVASRVSVTVNATGSDTIQIPVVMNSNEAAQAADMLLKDKWAALAGTISQTVSEQFSYITPTDVIRVDSDGAVFRVRVGEITTQDGTVSYEATQDVQSAYTSDVEGITPPSPNVGMDIPVSPTLAIYANLPALRDQDDQPGIYVAATGVNGPWPGALIEVSRDSGLTWISVRNVLDASTVGQILTNLDDWNSDIPAKDQHIDVRLTGGELSSVTFAQILQDKNAALIGDEIIQFQTALLIGPREYRLSRLVRGRKNTEVTLHSAGENFALLDSVYFLPLQRSDMGRNLLFRAVTLGTANSEGILSSVSYTPARSVQEWPVTHVKAYRQDDDVLLTWTPRARMGNSASPYQSLYFTGYQITFTSGGLSRTYVIAAQEFTYTASMQTSDFGAPISTGLAYTIAAVNSISGAGVPRSGTV